MVDVAVIGVGQTRYGTFPEKRLLRRPWLMLRRALIRRAFKRPLSERWKPVGTNWEMWPPS